MKKTHTIAKAIGQSPRLQEIYSAARAEHTKEHIRKLHKPRKKKVKAKEIEALKNRAESVEGSEVPEIAFNGAEMGHTEQARCCDEFNERVEINKWNGA